MKKYEFTGETKQINLLFGTATVHRIRAVVDFGFVTAGDLGGWVEKEENLSHDGNAWLCGNAVVCNNALVYGNAVVRGNALVCNNALVYGNALVRGDALMRGNAEVCGNAEIFSATHVLVIGAIGSRNGFTTFFRDKDEEISVKCGCFLGKIDRFLEKVTSTHGNSKYALVYRAAVELAKLQINITDEPLEMNKVMLQSIN